MTVIARRIISIPVRSASESWGMIVDLLAAQTEAEIRKELLGICGVVSSLIADEAMKDAPIVVYGSGPRVRIYCLYGEDAITGENANEAAFPSFPTEGDWRLSLPCPSEDLEWIQNVLKKKSSRITARNMTTEMEIEKSPNEQANQALINKEAFFRL